MRRKIGAGIALIMVVIVLLAAGCSQPAAAPPTSTAAAPKATSAAPAPAAAGAAAPAAKVTTFKLSTGHGPAQWQWSKIHQPFKAEVEQRSNGQVKIEIYGSNQLVPPDQALAAFKNGTVDLCMLNPALFPDYMPLEQVFNLPASYADSAAGTAWYWKLYPDYMKPSYDKLDIRAIGGYLTGSFLIFSSKKSAQKIEDFKGWSIVGHGEFGAKLLQSFGMSVMVVSTAEAYEQLQKGILDASPSSPALILNRKWAETGKPGYLIDVGGLGGTAVPLGMRAKAYNDLSKDLQLIIDDAAQKYYTKVISEEFAGEDAAALAALLKAGVKLVTWTNEEKARLKTAAQPFWADFGKQMDAKGLPATKMIAALKDLQEKSGAK